MNAAVTADRPGSTASARTSASRRASRRALTGAPMAMFHRARRIAREIAELEPERLDKGVLRPKQRKGLDLRVPAPTGEPRYVLSIQPVSNTVVVGSREELAVTSLRGIRPTWTQGIPGGSWRGFAQVRAHGEAMPATISADEQRMHVELDRAATGIAPGQAVVVYDGDRVVGSSTIDATGRQ